MFGLVELQKERARTELARFTAWTKPDYQTAWHNALICRYLDRLVEGDITRLMIFCPPRHGKSELVSRRLPAYFLGRNPTSHVILSAYSADLADRMNRDVQRIMDSPAYRQLFPFVRLPEVGSRSNTHAMREKRTDSLFEIVGRRGSLRSAGIGVGITGMGFHLGIIDDPIKDWEEAHSTVIRDKVDEWYTSTFWTRQESAKDGQQARILLTMTRWHHDDLAGRLIERAEQDKDADQWTILRLPALADYDLHEEDEREPGEALWPGRYDERFMAKARASLGSYLFTGMYQQTPTVEGGQHFKEDWFSKRFSFMTDDRGEHVLVPDGLGGADKFAKCDCTIFATCDPAASEKQAADFTAIAVWLLTPKNDLCLVDMVRERLGVNNITPRLYEICKRWGVSFVGIENSGFQLAIIRECRRTLGMPPVRELSHENKSKLVRATPAIIKAEAGQILLLEGADWIKRYVDELIKFTGLEDKHDDQVDVTAYAVWQLPRMGKDVELDREIEQEHSSTRPEHTSYAEERGLWGRGMR